MASKRDDSPMTARTRRASPPRKAPKPVEAWAAIDADGNLRMQAIEVIPIVSKRTYHSALHLFPDADAVLKFHDRGGVTPIRVRIAPVGGRHGS